MACQRRPRSRCRRRCDGRTSFRGQSPEIIFYKAASTGPRRSRVPAFLLHPAHYPKGRLPASHEGRRPGGRHTGDPGGGVVPPPGGHGDNVARRFCEPQRSPRQGRRIVSGGEKDESGSYVFARLARRVDLDGAQASWQCPGANTRACTPARKHAPAHQFWVDLSDCFLFCVFLRVSFGSIFGPFWLRGGVSPAPATPPPPPSCTMPPPRNVGASCS